MLYNEKQIRTIINNAVTTAGIDAAVVNGRPVGVLDEQSDFTRYGNLVLQPSVANLFINSLYNQFIYRATRENFFTSPFDRFRERREGVAYGEYEADVQPILPIPYDMKAFDRILDFWDTPVVVQYFAINRRDTFPQTIVKEMLKDAFISYDHFDNFLAKLIMAPRKGNVLVETNAVKSVINKNVAAGAVKTVALGTTASFDEDDYKALAAKIVGYASAMSAEPSKDFNNYAAIEGTGGQEVYTQSDRRDLVLIGDSEFLAKIRTYVLAFAMHNEEIDFNFTFVNVNSFDFAPYDSENRTFGDKVESPIKLILCDGGWIKLEDNLDEEFSNTNAMTMGVQRALQVQQTIGIRAYRNAIAFCEGVEGGAEMLRLNTDTNVFYPVQNPDRTAGGADVSVISVKGTPTQYNSETHVVTPDDVKATIGIIGGEQTSYGIPDNAVVFHYYSTAPAGVTGNLKKKYPAIEARLNGSLLTSEDEAQYLTITATIDGVEIVLVCATTLSET